ncbi:hypothetical protein PALB_5080 [Pseudoalteromonas luteoviolacea B = ATCC 29581]|nr:hypothetical protein PALB_5080 [Pseudoalteromonas luteoviolacea B = ATCC 29581]
MQFLRWLVTSFALIVLLEVGQSTSSLNSNEVHNNDASISFILSEQNNSDDNDDIIDIAVGEHFIGSSPSNSFYHSAFVTNLNTDSFQARAPPALA